MSENWGGNSAGGVQGRWRREGGDFYFWESVKVKVFQLSFCTFSLVWEVYCQCLIRAECRKNLKIKLRISILLISLSDTGAYL